MLRPLRVFRLSLLCALFLSTAQVFCAYAEDTPARGTLLKSSLLASYTKDQLNAGLQRLGLQARYGIKLFRVNYQSQIAPGTLRPAEASGLVIIPDVAIGQLPWISLQHGTVAGKNEAPSLSPGEGLYEASQGFVTAVMDYFGYGSSANEFHPYLIAQAYVPAGVDLLRATRRLASDQGITLGRLFLQGYSEGGYATLALQKALESDYRQEFTITASAPSAGPYDLEAAALTALSRPQYNPLIASFLLLAYDRWLAPELDLDAMFAVEAAKVESLFNDTLSSSEILKALPRETRKLFKGAFLDDFLKDQPQSAQARLMRRLLVDQSLDRDSWVPMTPTRLYHCADDEVVTVKATENTLSHFKALKADAPVTATIVQSPDAKHPYTHGSCPLIFAPVSWFSEFLNP